MKKFQDFIDEQIELSEVDSMSTRLKKKLHLERTRQRYFVQEKKRQRNLNLNFHNYKKGKQKSTNDINQKDYQR